MPAYVANVCKTVIRWLPRLVKELETANKLKSIEIRNNTRLLPDAEIEVNEIMEKS